MRKLVLTISPSHHVMGWMDTRPPNGCQPVPEWLSPGISENNMQKVQLTRVDPGFGDGTRARVTAHHG